MMSLQTSTHSSQMKTVGPAMSLRTSFWSLLQKEQRSTSVSPFFLAMIGAVPAARPRGGPARARQARLRITSSMIPYSFACSGRMM